MFACQNLIVRSLLPPPVARIEFAHGQNAKALTAALWGSTSLIFGDETSETSQIEQQLSFPPTASSWESLLSARPVEVLVCVSGFGADN